MKEKQSFIYIHGDPSRSLLSHKKRSTRGFSIPRVLFALAACSSISMVLISISLPTDETAKQYPDPNYKKASKVLFREEEVNPCSRLGCAIYPPELTEELRQSVSQTKHGGVSSMGDASYAMVTRIGESHRFNQDRAVLFKPFVTNLSPSASQYDSFLLALFDGHGRHGHVVAEYCIQEFPDRLAKKLNNLPKTEAGVARDKDILKALNETFVETDIYAPPNALKGGATATVSLRIGSKLYVANAGDSQTILVAADSSIAYMTRKDKALLPDERSRIEALGGKIFVNPQNVSRVVVYSVTAREAIALAMSRSIGDWEWKPVGVTAEPGSLNVVDLTRYPNSFLIAASDGLWDRRRREFFAKQFSESFVHKKMSPTDKLLEVIDKITPKEKKGYLDDITAVAIRI